MRCLSVLNLCLSQCVVVTRYGWVWGVATRPTEHLNITVKRLIRDGNHHADVNHTILRTRQRLSAITELMAMVDRAHGQPTTASDAVLVTQRQLWRFAVHRQEMTCSLHGRKFVVEGVRMNEIILDLHRCGRHCCHRTGRDWKGMLPALKHIMQQCRLYLLVENKVRHAPGPPLITSRSGEILMSAEQQQYLNDMFAKIQVAGKEGHAQVFSRLEIVSTRFKEKVPLRCM